VRGELARIMTEGDHRGEQAGEALNQGDKQRILAAGTTRSSA